MTAKEKKLLSRAMAILGSQTSEKKAKASRENGKLGGRSKQLETDIAQVCKELEDGQKLTGEDMAVRVR